MNHRKVKTAHVFEQAACCDPQFLVWELGIISTSCTEVGKINNDDNC